MSRIGNVPIDIPAGVNVEVQGFMVEVSGQLGKLTLRTRPELKVEVINGSLGVKPKKEDKKSKSLHGLTRTLLANMIIGVNTGWERKLELVGVGFRASTTGDSLSLSIGYSHPVEIKAPSDIKFRVDDNTKITVSGVDKIVVGQVAANIRKVRPPEPYKGKGIRFAGEYVRKKAGKAGKTAAKA